MSKKRSKKKLALKRETLRQLDNSELKNAAGGAVAYSYYCAGGSKQLGGTGGCTTETMLQAYNFNILIIGS